MSSFQLKITRHAARETIWHDQASIKTRLGYGRDSWLNRPRIWFYFQKANFWTRKIIRDKDRHYAVIKGPILQEDIKIFIYIIPTKYPLICKSLMTMMLIFSYIQSAISISSWVRCLFRSLAYFLIRLFALLPFSFKNSSYIFDTGPLLDMCFENMFFQRVAWHPFP